MSIPENYIKKINSPISIQLEMTDRCNERCQHCYNTWQIACKLGNTLNTEKIDYIINQLKENNVFHATVTGGEPLLEKELSLYAISGLISKGISVTMNSNLTLMDEEIAKQLGKSGLGYILTSLISSNPETHNKVSQTKNGFERWLNGVKNIQNHTNIAIGVNMVLTQFNKGDVYDTGKFLNSLGIKNFFVTRGSFPMEMHNFGNIAVSGEETLQGLDELLKVKEDFGMKVIDILECYPLCFLAEDPKYALFSNHKCTAGVTTATIGTDGMVRPCSHSNQGYGNIFTENLDIIRNKMDDRRSGEYLPEKCQSCEHLTDCSGGCRLDAEGAKGDIREMDPFAREKNIDKIKLLKKPNGIKIDSLMDQSIKVVNNIIIRKERDGYIVGKGLTQLFVTEDSGELLLFLKSKDCFSVKDIAMELGIDTLMLDKFLYVLYKKDILQLL